MVAWDLHPAQWVDNPQSMFFGPEDIFFAQCPPNNKIVENKAYNLPSGIIQLMTPKTGFVHTKKQSFMGRWLFKMKDPHCTETWKYFSKVLWESCSDNIGRHK